jgi:glycosyltransferase involved in cell wall biosynthesis
MVLVSVVLPSYNYGEYIAESIESVLNQSFRDLELIIVDDYSTDNAKEIIQEYRSKDKRIRAFFHTENKGISKTLNDGVAKAKGKFIAFTNADDVWVSSKLDKQLEVLKKNENLIVWSEGEVIDNKGRPTGETFSQKLADPSRLHPALKSGDIFKELLYGNFIFFASLILKKENIRDVEFDEHLKYLNDYKLEIDLAKRYKYYFIPEPLAKYRIHEKSTATRDVKAYHKDGIVAKKYVLQKYGSEIPNKLKAKLFFGISSNYSQVGRKEHAKQFALKAVNVNLLSKDNIFYLIFAIGSGDSDIGKFLLRAYITLTELSMQFFKELSQSRGREFFNYIVPYA